MKGIAAAENRVSLLLEAIVTVFFGIILGLTILLVILRYVFNTSITGGEELMEFLFIYTTALGAAVSIGKGDHINVSYFIDFLPPFLKALVETLSLTLVAGINIVLLWLSFPWIAKVGSSATPVLRLPSWIAMISVPIGCSLAVLYSLCNIYRMWLCKNDRGGEL